VGAFSVVTGAISRRELVMDNLSGGGVWAPAMLRSVWDRRGASTEVTLTVWVRDLRVRLEDRREGK
jgi:hypothetical protein